MEQLQGKVAIVTGGANGFGKAIARLYVAEGARVVVADMAEDKGQALAKELGPQAARFCGLRRGQWRGGSRPGECTCAALWRARHRGEQRWHHAP